MNQSKLASLFATAIEHQRHGRSILALDICKRIISKNPEFIDAYTMQGVIAAEQQNFDLAIVHFEKVVAIDPMHLGAKYNLAMMHQNKKNFDNAIVLFREILKADPSHVPSINGLGFASVELGEVEEAIRCFTESLAHNPNQPLTFNNLANCFVTIGLQDLAEEKYRAAINLSPNYADAQFNLSKLLFQQGKIDQAITGYEEILTTFPAFVQARINLGKIQIDRGCPEEALHLLLEGAKHANLSPELWFSLGVAWDSLSEPAQAVEAYSKALSLNPEYHEALVNRGVVHSRLKSISAAIDDCDRAINLAPDLPSSYWHKALALLSDKQWLEGWALFRYRFESGDVTAVPWLPGVPVWHLGAATRRALIMAEQGIGDEVFYTKFLRLFIQRHGLPSCVTLDKRIIPIIQRSFPEVRFIDREKSNELSANEFDVQMALGDLGPLLSIEPTSYAGVIQPHMALDQEPQNLLTQNFSKTRRRRIGLSWKSESSKIGKDKSINLKDLMTALHDIDAEWINLQYGEVDEEIQEVSRVLGIQVQDPEINLKQDIEGLLRLMRTCDCVVTTSNATAHLCGAIGQSGVVMVPYGKGRLWYWHLKDGPSDWYPSLVVVHGKHAKDWGSTFVEVRAFLEGRFGSTH
jgi:tetratricopeptide (TPR) repeat protein